MQDSTDTIVLYLTVLRCVEHGLHLETNQIHAEMHSVEILLHDTNWYILYFAVRELDNRIVVGTSHFMHHYIFLDVF